MNIPARLCFTLALGIASAKAQSPWDGTWLLDPARSTMKPAPLSIHRTGDRYLVGSLSCDSQPHLGSDGFTSTCTGHGAALRVTETDRHRPFSTVDYVLIPGGRILRATTTYSNGARPQVRQIDTYTRMAESPGLEGSWVGQSTTFTGPETYVLRLRNNRLYYLDTAEGAVSEAPLDGTPTPFQDPHPASVRWANRWEGPRRIFGQNLIDGKPGFQEILEISPDGKTLRNWIVGQEQDVLILVKQ